MRELIGHGEVLECYVEVLIMPAFFYAICKIGRKKKQFYDDVRL